MSFTDLPPQTPINPNADAYALTCLERSAAAAEMVPLAADIPYGPDYWQKLDVWRPAAAGADLPVLIFFHGGNFTHGYKEWCGFMAPAVTTFPAVFVSASYRLFPQTAYRHILDDPFAALALVRERIGEHGGDPGRVFIGGHSAGAQIVAEMALRHDRRRAAGLTDEAFRGVFPMSGSYARRLGSLEVDPALRVADDVPDSPIELAGAARHPFFIAWGGVEKPQVLENGRAFAGAVEATGVETLARELPGLDHFAVHLNTGSAEDPWTVQVREWMLR
jgi:arylformamidase